MTNTTNHLTPPTYPCAAFTRVARTNTTTLVAEASDLGLRAGRVPFGRLYADAADVGLALTSSRTGKTARFVLEAEHHNADNDITHWTFVATPETARDIPSAANLLVTVFND